LVSKSSITDGVKIFEDNIVTFDFVISENGNQKPIKIFTTDVFSIGPEEWLLLDRDQMKGVVYPSLVEISIDAEPGSNVYYH
jgi:hypothetical protein